MGGTDGSVSDINFNCVVINIMTSSNQPSSRDLMLIAALNTILLEDVNGNRYHEAYH